MENQRYDGAGGIADGLPHRLIRFGATLAGSVREVLENDDAVQDERRSPARMNRHDDSIAEEAGIIGERIPEDVHASVGIDNLAEIA